MTVYITLKLLKCGTRHTFSEFETWKGGEVLESLECGWMLKVGNLIDVGQLRPYVRVTNVMLFQFWCDPNLNIIVVCPFIDCFVHITSFIIFVKLKAGSDL